MAQKGRATSGISPRCGALRDEAAEARTVPGQGPVKRVNHRRESYRAKDAAQRTGETHLRKEHHSSA